jgi:hypothetical protein
MNIPSTPGQDHRDIFGSVPLQSGEGVFLTGVRGRQTLHSERSVAASKVSATGTTAPHPFLCPSSTDGSTASAVVSGTVNGVTVTNLSLVISATGTKEVYLDVTYTQDVSANNYVRGFSGGITCALATGSSIPADTSTHLYRRVATYVSGVKTAQPIQSSMEVAARDDGTGTATTRAIWTRA